MIEPKRVEEILTKAIGSLGEHEGVSIMLLALDDDGNFYFITPWDLDTTIGVLENTLEVVKDKGGERRVH